MLFIYYYYCLYYHSLCWCSFCASAGRNHAPGALVTQLLLLVLFCYIYLLVLSAPGTTVLCPFLWCFEAPSGFSTMMGRECCWFFIIWMQLIPKADNSGCLFIAVLSAGTRDTKYEASASTLSKPAILSGPTKSYNDRKLILFVLVFFKFLYFNSFAETIAI